VKTCLVCQHGNAVERDLCERCATPLPEAHASTQARRLKRFQWFCPGPDAVLRGDVLLVAQGLLLSLGQLPIQLRQALR